MIKNKIGWIILLLISPIVSAKIVIDVSQSIEQAYPIAIIPFEWLGPGPTKPEKIALIIQSNLRRSGYFSPLAVSDQKTQPHTLEQVDYSQWQGMDYLVIGQLRGLPNARYELTFQLIDQVKKELIAGYKIVARANNLRRSAHQASDLIYEKITHDKGVFTTRIAYVTVIRAGRKISYHLQVADADGNNPKTVLKSKQPVMSPNWSPDGKQLAYVSFEDRRSAIYIQNVSTGKRQQISSSKGINGAPAWSHDGQQLAMTLSKDGSPDIYIINLNSGQLQRITDHRAIDTEPVWSVNDEHLFFTSDRGGKPQIYKIAIAGGKAKRLTFEGNYNARSVLSADGKNLAMVHGRKGKFHIAVLELDSGNINVLTSGRLDESPSFSPNGKMILYATEENNKNVLAAVSIDGHVKQRLVSHDGHVQEPAWSPW